MKHSGIRRKKTPKQREKEYLDSLLSRHIRNQAGNRCEYCGGDRLLGAAHILSKGAHPRLRYEPYNILCLCFRDHIEGWHKNAKPYLDWLEEKWPGRYQRLLIADRCAPKADVKLLIAIWEKQCQDL